MGRPSYVLCLLKQLLGTVRFTRSSGIELENVEPAVSGSTRYEKKRDSRKEKHSIEKQKQAKGNKDIIFRLSKLIGMNLTRFHVVAFIQTWNWIYTRMALVRKLNLVYFIDVWTLVNMCMCYVWSSGSVQIIMSDFDDGLPKFFVRWIFSSSRYKFIYS